MGDAARCCSDTGEAKSSFRLSYIVSIVLCVASNAACLCVNSLPMSALMKYQKCLVLQSQQPKLTLQQQRLMKTEKMNSQQRTKVCLQVFALVL